MDNLKLKASLRDNGSFSTIRKLREDGYIPGVLYGFEKSNQLVQLKERELKKHLKKHGKSSIFNIELGDEIIPVKLNEIQKNKINDKLIHFDLQSIEINKEVDIAVPIQLVGQSIGVKNGGTMHQQMRSIKVRSFPYLIPESIALDISELNIGDNIFVKELYLSNDIEIMDELNALVLTILAPKGDISEDNVVIEKEVKNPEMPEEKDHKEASIAK